MSLIGLSRATRRLPLFLLEFDVAAKVVASEKRHANGQCYAD
jgi:hypothetical protein